MKAVDEIKDQSQCYNNYNETHINLTIWQFDNVTMSFYCQLPLPVYNSFGY